ncbi:MAG TPA: hypothetical protein DCZ43_09060 [candidate division Zixibacteria bacterium]|nr:hypothetical protein [candidate division Zixibacteria bacterium]
MKGEFSFGQRVLLVVAAILGPSLIRLYGLTWRVRWEGVDDLAVARSPYGQVLFCFWHSRLLSLCYTHRGRNIGIMVSKSFDGEWISRIVTKLGYRVFRGSASRDGAKALISMLRSSGGDLSLTVDGPTGPAEKVKPGIITLASHSNLPLVPITCVAEKAWRLRSWDRFIIPKPFSKLTVRYGKMIPIPAELNEDQLRGIIKQIEDGINRIG